MIPDILSKREGKVDMVNNPPHYTKGGIECIEAIKASMTPEEFAGFLKGQVLKYMWRFEDKWDPVEDVEKAQFYMDELAAHMRKHPDIFGKGDHSRKEIEDEGNGEAVESV